jgi:multidrug resistance efflux pump
VSPHNENEIARSEAMQEIIGQVPHWLIRWGMTTIFFTMLILLLLSFFIKYPDILSARITIYTQTPPMRIVARAAGELEALFVQENQPVHRGDYLAAIKNPAMLVDMLQVKKTAASMESSIVSTNIAALPALPNSFALGDVQPAYSRFLQSCSDYRYFCSDRYFQTKIRHLQSQIAYYTSLQKTAENQREIAHTIFTLAQKKHAKYTALFEQKYLSEVDMAVIENELLQAKIAAATADNNCELNNVQIDEYQKGILDLQQQSHERERSLVLSLQDAFRSLQGQIAAWEQAYILKAPIAGRVSFYKFWSKNQFVSPNEEVMTVIPTADQLVGKIYLPQAGAGKVKAGQRVNIKLDNYPFAEFGIVDGIVGTISPISRENLLTVNVTLPDRLKTSYHKELDFKQEMQGVAEIVTEDLSLFARFFNQIRSLLIYSRKV